MMKWLIVGLGNPGDRYRQTRHNVGFMVVEELGKKLEAGSWKLDKKFKAETAEAGGVLLVKPQTFMNLSGEAVGGLARFYKIPPERIIIVHDDLDLRIGSVKLNLGKGPKQHNGIISIEKALDTIGFWRLRVGVDDRTIEQRGQLTGQDYVLKPMSSIERQALETGTMQASQKIEETIHAA